MFFEKNALDAIELQIHWEWFLDVNEFVENFVVAVLIFLFVKCDSNDFGSPAMPAWRGHTINGWLKEHATAQLLFSFSCFVRFYSGNSVLCLV